MKIPTEVKLVQLVLTFKSIPSSDISLDHSPSGYPQEGIEGTVNL